MKYIDAHCHLSNPENFSDVFMRANANGIVGCVLNSVSESDWQSISKLTHDNANIRGAIGIHPWYTETVSKAWQDNLIYLLNTNPNLMIGEIGLDKTRDNFASQEKVFISALEIAIKFNRIINLHCVHAWERVLEILKSYHHELPTIVAHGFDGTQNAIDFNANIYFSYSPNIANPKYKRMAESVLRVPKNKILIESDSSDLSRVILAARGVSAIRSDVSPDDILQNAKRIFFNG